MNKIEAIMEEAEIQLYDNWDSWASDMSNLRAILEKHLQEPEEREDICLRCWLEHKEVKREWSNWCHSRWFHYPKHLWK